MGALAVIALLAGTTTPAATKPAAEGKITVFVGPQTRDGFADVDSGILDSIKDIQDEFRRSGQFAIARTSEEAQIVLVVLGRRTPGDSGTMGIPAGTLTLQVPIKRRAIDTIVCVGSYEKPITSESGDDDRWKAAAKRVVKDVAAWVSANRSSLKRLESPR
jgi:hypothetical protein